MDLSTDDDIDLLLGEATIGVEMEKFITSPHGRFLYLRAKNEIKTFTEWAMSSAANGAEFEAKRIDAVAAKTLIRWITEAIGNGRNAETQLEQNRNEQAS